MANLSLALLGPPQVERDGQPVSFDNRKALALLAYLAVTGQRHTRDGLAALLWPEYERERAYANLRSTIWALRKALGAEWLATDREQVGLRAPDAVQLDVALFRQGRDRQRQHDPPNTLCPNCLRLLAEAVTLYRGDFLSGFTLADSPDFDEWRFFEAERLRQDLANILERLTRHHAGQGAFEPAIAYARRWLELDPLDEAVHRHLMQLYARAGQRAAALRQYQECARIVERELGTPPMDETCALYEQIRAGASSELRVLSSELSVSKPGTQNHALERSEGSELITQNSNLPPQPTPFVGREEELVQIAGLLRDTPACRLLTLVGLGGIGKTRLALEAAAAQLETFPDGVYLVSLASVSSPAFLATSIAEALGLTLEGKAALQAQLLASLRDKRLLLLLDNFEHLLEPGHSEEAGGADLLLSILTHAPSVKLLVTSRRRLSLHEEWILEVAGLPYPEGANAVDLETYAAIRLFAQSARRIRPSFGLTADTHAAVAQICRMVGGMPLGIELAAAWVRSLSCDEIADELAHNLDVLTSSLRNTPERHRSLRAVLEYSWSLLSEVEQQALARLAVFRGGFGRDAAAQVARASLPALATLVDRCLLYRRHDRSRHSARPEGRYGLHELVRQYAEAQLAADSAAAEALRHRHALYYLTLAEQAEPALQTADQQVWLERLDREHNNLRAALG